MAAVVVPVSAQPASAQIDAAKIADFKAQQTQIELRIVDLQNQVDDANADDTYCSPEQRQEVLRKLRALRRDIAALHKDYADFKRAVIQLALRPTSGPQFDAAGIHPLDRSYWTEDDNALQKLSPIVSREGGSGGASAYHRL